MKISNQLLLFLPLAIAIGVALAAQTAINAQLREYLNSPLQAALLSFIIGTIMLGVCVFFQPIAKPSFSMLSNIPWYLWLGGFLGAYAISMSIISAPKLGFLTLFGLIVFGQICTSMFIDQFGLLGADKTPISWQRFLGGVLVLFGVLLTLQR